MHGIQLDNLLIDDVRYMKYDVTLKFTTYSGEKLKADFVTFPTNRLKEASLSGSFYKVFVRKRTPFSKSTYFLCSAWDHVLQSALGMDLCYLELRKGNLYIVCLNPNDWDIKIYAPCDRIKEKLSNKYGLCIYNSNALLTYHSEIEPLMAYQTLEIDTLLPNNTIVYFPKMCNGCIPAYSERNIPYPKLFELKQNIKKLPNCYVELGTFASLSQRLKPDRVNLVYMMASYSLLIDSTGEVSFRPIFMNGDAILGFFNGKFSKTAMPVNVFKSSPSTIVIK